MSTQPSLVKHSRRRNEWWLRILAIVVGSVILLTISGILVFAHLANRVILPAAIVVKPNDPYSLLAEANRRAWLFNPSAARLFADAETRFHEMGDERNESWARIGRIRGETLTTSFT